MKLEKQVIELGCPWVYTYADVYVCELHEVHGVLDRNSDPREPQEVYWLAKGFIEFPNRYQIDVEKFGTTKEIAMAPVGVWEEVNCPRGLAKIERILQWNINEEPVYYEYFL